MFIENTDYLFHEHMELSYNNVNGIDVQYLPLTDKLDN